MKKKRLHIACGSWFSPIHANLVASSFHDLSQLQVSHGILYWVEQFSAQKGRRAIKSCDTHGQIRELTSRDFNVRNRVHEYGGGDYWVHHDTLYFSNDRDQRIYRQAHDHMPQAITPNPQRAQAWRYADGMVTPDGNYFVCVRETHTDDQVTNEIVAIATDGSMRIHLLAAGADFYASPQISRNGQRLLYLAWNHPQMPWEGTQLYVTDFASGHTAGEPLLIAGSTTDAIFQPRFSSNGDIYFISDRSGWWNLYRYYYYEERITPVCPIDAEIGYPAWIFGAKTYELISDDHIICIVKQKGRSELMEIVAGQITKIQTEFDDFAPSLASDGQRIYAVGANAASAPAIFQLDLTTRQIKVLHSSSNVLLDADYLALPTYLEFPTEHQQTAYAYFYPPTNPHYQPRNGELPPLIVLCHGGPTSATTTALNLKIQYWTSRGFAVVDVNYGGSSGYGRAYRHRLHQQWGKVDVADCVHAAKYLVAQGKVDPERLIIKGGSAGGFTALCAVAFYDIFAAGVSYYGVADLVSLLKDTHKFESHYLELLVGPYPQMAARYRERSPLYYAEKIRCPMIFLQGLEDRVVPPMQAETMLAAFEKNGLPYAYVKFPHEQHGFRDSQSIKKALEVELSFYAQIFNFEPYEAVPMLALKNFTQT